MTRRLVLAALLIAAFVLLIVEVPLGLTYAGREQDRLLADVERDARVIAGLVEERIESGDTAGVTRIVERYSRQNGGRVVVTDASGRSIADSGGASARDFSTRPEVRTAMSGTQAVGIRSSSTLDEEVAYAAVPVVSDGRVTGVVRVSVPTTHLRDQIRDNWIRLVVLSLLVLTAAGTFGWLVARWAVAPVSRLEDGARRLAAGDLGGRTEVDRGPPELRQLSLTFDEMAARLEVLVRSQTAFVADASHQLRTPLTVLRLRVDSIDAALAEDPVDRDALSGDIEVVAGELDRLMRIVDGLLALARSETRSTIEVVDVVEVVRSAVQRWDALAAERDVALDLTAPTSLAARAVAGSVEQVLDNLIDNAVEVAPAGSVILLAVAAVGSVARISVRDHGPGLTPAQRERATDRFWRAPAAPPGGTGLGLAVVAELVGASGGELRLLAPDDGSGLVVEVDLPRR